MGTVTFPVDHINNTPYYFLIGCGSILLITMFGFAYVIAFNLTDPFQSRKSFAQWRKRKLWWLTGCAILFLATLIGFILLPHYPIVTRASIAAHCADKDFTCELDKGHVRADDPKEWKDNITVKKNGVDYSITAVAHEDEHTIMVVEKGK